MDFSSTGFMLICASCSFCLFFFCFMFLFDVFFLQFRFYQKFSLNEKVRWNDVLSSSIHAILCCFGAALAFLRIPYEQRFQFFDVKHSTGCFVVASFSLGYFLFHLPFCILPNIKKDGWLMVMHHLVMHHLVSIFTLSYSILIRQYGPGICILLLMEVSTPAISNIHFLIKLGMRRTPLFLFNGFGVVVLWGISRIPTAPLLFYIYWSCWDQVLKRSWFECVYYPSITMFFGMFNALYFIILLKTFRLEVQGERNFLDRMIAQDNRGIYTEKKKKT